MKIESAPTQRPQPLPSVVHKEVTVYRKHGPNKYSIIMEYANKPKRQFLLVYKQYDYHGILVINGRNGDVWAECRDAGDLLDAKVLCQQWILHGKAVLIGFKFDRYTYDELPTSLGTKVQSSRQLQASMRLASTKICGCLTASCVHAKLTKKQEQLDINGDGEIDSEDLKRLRNGEKPVKAKRRLGG